MNEFYSSFIAAAKDLAAREGLRWELPYNEVGKVAKAERWNLTLLRGMVPPPAIWLSDFSCDARSLAALNRMRAVHGLSPLAPAAMSPAWQDLYKAIVLNELLVKHNKPGHAAHNVGRYVRLLGVCSGSRPPWDLNQDIVQRAYNVALQVGQSGKLAFNLSMVIRTTIDGLHLADRSPLAGACLPYPTDEAQAAEVRVRKLRRRNATSRDVDRKRAELSERKRAARLPEEKAFWELVRIVFTEQPQTFSDAIRFAQVKLAIVTGFRIGENVTVPLDWERWREYVTTDGRPAGERGGISRSLMIRHFAEKQAADEGAEGVVLYEAVQHVPPMFEELVLETLGQVAELTAPMRDRLRQQIKTGRLLPEFGEDELLPAWDLYSRLTGSMRIAAIPLHPELVAEYRTSYAPALLDRIRSWQERELHGYQANPRIGMHWGTWAKESGLVIRSWNGDALAGRIDWRKAYLRVGDVEERIPTQIPTKLPDTAPFSLADGSTLAPAELLFLMPIRALAENRNAGVVDVSRYFAIGRADPVDLQLHLGGRKGNLFSRYGQTDEDRRLALTTHSLRHLQNAELFRLGVADTIITKRFNRGSVAQSYEYDHRSLAEDLDRITLPAAAEQMGPRAQEALRMIRARRVSGPIVEEFLRLQREQGDDAAFEYLDAEADGLHVTPYGFCLNSFTVDPCPKHLECFNGCRHLSRSTLPKEQRNLERLRDRMKDVIAKLERTAPDSRLTGWQNQMKHAQTRLENIEKTLTACPGSQPFPDGADLYRGVEDMAGTTILDTSPVIRRAE